MLIDVWFHRDTFAPETQSCGAVWLYSTAANRNNGLRLLVGYCDRVTLKTEWYITHLEDWKLLCSLQSNFK